MAFLLALLTALPDLLRLLNLLGAMWQEKEQQGVGRTEAIKEVLISAHKELAMADAVRLEADAAHKDPTDDAFDRAYERKP